MQSNHMYRIKLDDYYDSIDSFIGEDEAGYYNFKQRKVFKSNIDGPSMQFHKLDCEIYIIEHIGLDKEFPEYLL